MSTELKHDQFRKAGINSIFLGNFSSEIELDEFLTDKFPTDFGFKIYPPAGPEADVNPEENCLLEKLFDGFSEADKFLKPTVKALAEAGCHRASTAVIFYNFEYNPKLYKKFNHFGPLTFVDTFHKEKVELIPFLND